MAWAVFGAAVLVASAVLKSASHVPAYLWMPHESQDEHRTALLLQDSVNLAASLFGVLGMALLAYGIARLIAGSAGRWAASRRRV